jgi:hypothetical protein
VSRSSRKRRSVAKQLSGNGKLRTFEENASDETGSVRRGAIGTGGSLKEDGQVDDPGDTEKAGGAKVPPRLSPNGARFAVERWIELTDDEAPWWAKPTGVGLRLQLHEIIQLSSALQEGKVVAAAVKRLLIEAHAVFVDEGRYCAQVFPEITKRLRGALREKEASELLPGGIALAAVDAALGLLEQTNLVDKLIVDTSSAAQDSESLEDLLCVDERITLLDAELIFDGYSREWRARAAQAARSQLDRGGSLAEALTAGLDISGRSERSDYEVIIPLGAGYRLPEDIALTAETVVELNKAEDLVSEWPDSATLLPELKDAKAALRLSQIKARDVDAAAEQARDRFGRSSSIWVLQGGALVPCDNLLLRDLDNQTAEKRAMQRQLVERPAGLKAYGASRKSHEDHPAIRRIADALDQLAQVRSESHGASLADLWTVAETLFGGLAEDRSTEVSDRLGGLAEYLYVRDLLSWLGSRFDPAALNFEGLVRDTGESEAEWGLRCADVLKETLPAELIMADRLLEWMRLSQVLRWDTRRNKPPRNECYLGTDLDAVRDRVTAVGNRAYLVRNLFLHQGNPQRAAAMAVTLPIFASVLRAAIGHVNRCSGERRLPLAQSEIAHLRIRHVATTYFAQPKSGPALLSEFVDLSDE